jgi:hypothetical protein
MHGQLSNRQYLERHNILADNFFDPHKDIVMNNDKCWEWATNKPELHRQLDQYFQARRKMQ